jgi:lysophospholipase L1-like esterase
MSFWQALPCCARINVACVGDSITYGYSLSNPTTQSYPAQLQAMLGSNYVVTNFGVSSTTMLKNGNDPYWNTSAYSSSLKSRPNIVIIMLGTNDSKPLNWTPYGSQYIGDYESMISSYTSLSTHPTVYICYSPAYNLPNPWDDANTFPDPTRIPNLLIPAIQIVKTQTGQPLIDNYDTFVNHPELYNDGIHPNTQGAYYLAQDAYDAITGKQDFKLMASAPGNLSLFPGQIGTNTVTITPVNGFAGSVSLSLSGLPSGVTASFSPSVTTSTSTLTVNAGSGAAPGVYTMTLTGTSGTLTHTESFTLGINQPSSLANGTYTLTPQNATVLRLNAINGGATNGTLLDVEAYTGASNQKWIFTKQSSGWYTIQPSYDTSLVVETQYGGLFEGMPIDLWTDSGAANQRWNPILISGNIYKLNPENAPGLMLDVYGSGSSSGTPIDFWPDSGSSNQQWAIGTN